MKNRLRRYSVWSVLAGLLLISVFPGFGQEILNNGGFESGDSGWTHYTSGDDSSVSVVSEAVFQGGSAVRLSIGEGVENETAAVYQPVSVEPGSHLRFSYAIKTDSVEFWSFAFFQWLDADGNMVLENSFYPSSDTTDWRVYDSRVTVPPDVHGLIVFLILTGQGGTAWFDSISLMPETAISVTPFSVNVAGNIGTIHPFLSTNAGPVSVRSGVNLISSFKAMGVHSVRTHDYHGPCDIHGIFPDWNLSADDPTAYQFETTDRIIAAIVESNARVFFRLGESYETEPVHNEPPPDPDKWAEVCRHIVLHYNRGWDKGFYYNIRYWEIWNEPDIRVFWSGTPAQYVTLYEKAAAAIKSVDQSLQVGGPAVSTLTSTVFLDTFLSKIRDHGTPLDFFSYHYYNTGNPYFYIQMNRDARALLSRYGLDNVELFLTEWNTWIFDPSNTLDWGRDDPLNAAAAAATIIYLQDADLRDAFRYRSDEYYFGLFHDDGSASYSGLVFQALGNFRQTPVRLPVSGGDKLGRVILAGRSENGEEMAVLISDTGSTEAGYEVRVNGLEEGQHYFYFQWRIDSSHTLEQVGTGILGQSAPIIASTLSAPYVELILIYREKVFHLPSPVRHNFPVSLSEN